MVGVGVGACVVGDTVVLVAVGVVVVGVGVVVAGLWVPEECAVEVVVAVAEWLPVADPDGEKIAGRLDVGVPPVHAETVAETRTIKAAQLRTVSRALPAVPGMLMRAFIKASLNARRAASSFPLPGITHRARQRMKKRVASRITARVGGS